MLPCMLGACSQGRSQSAGAGMWQQDRGPGQSATGPQASNVLVIGSNRSAPCKSAMVQSIGPQHAPGGCQGFLLVLIERAVGRVVHSSQAGGTLTGHVQEGCERVGEGAGRERLQAGGGAALGRGHLEERGLRLVHPAGHAGQQVERAALLLRAAPGTHTQAGQQVPYCMNDSRRALSPAQQERPRACTARLSGTPGEPMLHLGCWSGTRCRLWRMTWDRQGWIRLL